MSQAAKRTRTGRVRTVLLTPDQDARLNMLCSETGINRNQIVRMVAEKLTVTDVMEIVDRPTLI